MVSGEVGWQGATLRVEMQVVGAFLHSTAGCGGEGACKYWDSARRIAAEPRRDLNKVTPETRMPPLVRQLVSVTFVCLCLGWAPLQAQESEKGEARSERAAVAPAQSNPRETIKTFFEAMRGFKAGNDDRLMEAVNCLYLGDGLTPAERLNAGAAPADTLYKALDRVQFEMESITAEPSGRNLALTFGVGEGQFELHLRQYDDSRWRISSQSLTPEFLAGLESQTGAQEARAHTFVTGLQSPRAAMESFIKGMNEQDGFAMEDAINAMDLSEVNEVDRESVGASKASDLKDLIDRIKLVEFSEISPDSDGDTYVFYQDPTGLGSIALAPVPDVDDPEMKAWRFTKGTLAKDNLEALYLAYKDRPLVAGLQQRQRPESRPWANRIRDWTSDNYPGLLKEPLYLQNYQWIGLVLLIFVGVTISRLLTLIIGTFIRFWFRRKGYAYDNRLEKDFIRPIRIASMAWVWLYGLELLQLHPDALKLLRIAASFITSVGVVWAAYCLVDIIGKYLTEMARKSVSKHDDLLVPIIVRTLKIVVVAAGIVAFAFQLKGDATQIFAGLGLGGLAFALAAKDVVANVFGSITILTDRPFRIGDWVTIGEIDGSVESVGIRSTRIRTFYNSLITVPNSQITTAHIDNMGARRYRRITATLGLTYDTPPERIEAFCEGIRELIRKHPYTRKDYYHVYFNGYSASSLDILVYCFVETPDWGTELREKHRLFLDILRLAREVDISFAFPTQTLFVHQEAYDAPRDGATGPAVGVEAARTVLDANQELGGMPPPPVTFNSNDDTSSRTMKD